MFISMVTGIGKRCKACMFHKYVSSPLLTFPFCISMQLSNLQLGGNLCTCKRLDKQLLPCYPTGNIIYNIDGELCPSLSPFLN